MKKRIEVFLFVDALGWELVRETRFLERELPERRKIRMQFGYSCTAIPTILSGKTPSDHGHLSLFCYDPEHSPFKLLGLVHPLLRPRSFWNRGRVRNLLSKVVRKLYGYTGYFQLYRMPLDRIGKMDYCEKKNLFVAKGMAPVENLCDVLEQSGLAFHISDWHLKDAENFAIGRRLLEEEKCEFLFLYTAGFDALEHAHVDDRKIIHSGLDFYADGIRGLIEAGTAHAGEFHITVFSDHGMTPLAGTLDLEAAIRQTGLVFGRDYAACCDSTMFRAYFLKPESEAVIREALVPFASSGRWLTREEERGYGIEREDRKFGDAIFLVNPGLQIVPSDMCGKPLNGMHGYDPDDPDSSAAILSNVPIPDDVTRVADYFGLMRRRIAELRELHR